MKQEIKKLGGLAVGVLGLFCVSIPNAQAGHWQHVRQPHVVHQVNRHVHVPTHYRTTHYYYAPPVHTYPCAPSHPIYYNQPYWNFGFNSQGGVRFNYQW